MTLRLALPLAVIGLALFATPALCRVYVCQVPRALLCKGCARDISIALALDGACRVSFTPGEQMGRARRSPPLRLVVKTQSGLARRAHVFSTAAHAYALPSGRCFLFNGSQYCE
jgi:hypothetical protein